MKIVEPSFEIQESFDILPIAARLEECGRICYKSEDAITDDSAIPFVKRIAASGRRLSFRNGGCIIFDYLPSRSCPGTPFLSAKIFGDRQADNGMVVTGSIRAFKISIKIIITINWSMTWFLFLQRKNHIFLKMYLIRIKHWKRILRSASKNFLL